MSDCESCGSPPPRITSGPFAGQTSMHGYCVHCSENLCANCLANGRCAESESGKHEREDEEDDGA